MNAPHHPEELERLEQLRAVETYLLRQLRQVRAAIAAAETRQIEKAVAGQWRIRLTPGGHQPIGDLHQGPCWYGQDKAGREITADQAARAWRSGRYRLQLCPVCKPPEP